MQQLVAIPVAMLRPAVWWGCLAGVLWSLLCTGVTAKDLLTLGEARGQIEALRKQLSAAVNALPTAEAEWQKAVRSYQTALRQALPAVQRINTATQALEHQEGKQGTAAYFARADLEHAYDEAWRAAVAPLSALAKAETQLKYAHAAYLAAAEAPERLRADIAVLRAHADVLFEPPVIRGIRLKRLDRRYPAPIVLYEARWEEDAAYKAIDLRVRNAITFINQARSMENHAREQLDSAGRRLKEIETQWQTLNEQYAQYTDRQLMLRALLEAVDVLHGAKTAGPGLGGYLVYQLGEKGLEFWQRYMGDARTVTFPTLSDELVKVRAELAQGDMEVYSRRGPVAAAHAFDLLVKETVSEFTEDELTGLIEGFLMNVAEEAVEIDFWPVVLGQLHWQKLTRPRAKVVFDPLNSNLVEPFRRIMQTHAVADAGEDLKPWAKDLAKVKDLFKDKLFSGLKAAGKAANEAYYTSSRIEVFHRMALVDLDYFVERNRLRALGNQIKLNRQLIRAAERNLDKMLGERASRSAKRTWVSPTAQGAYPAVAASEWTRYSWPPVLEIDLVGPRETRLILLVAGERLLVPSTGFSGIQTMDFRLRKALSGELVLAFEADRTADGEERSLDADPGSIAQVGADLKLVGHNPGRDTHHRLNIVEPMVSVGAGVQTVLDGESHTAEVGATLDVRYSGPPFLGSWIGIVPKDGPPVRSFDGGPHSYHLKSALETGSASLKVPEAAGAFVIAMFDAEKDGVPIAFIPLSVSPKLADPYWCECPPEPNPCECAPQPQ